MSHTLAQPVSATGGRDRASFRAFVDENVVPAADEWDRRQAIPDEVLVRLRRERYWGAALPKSVGGSGFDVVTVGELHEEVGRGCSSLRSLLTVHSMVGSALYRWGSDAARERWLPGVAAGDVLGAFCLTEPTAGSDAAGIACTADAVATGYVLNGTKRWITGGQIADLLLVFARTDGGPAAFLVESNNPGVRRTPIDNILGTRASMLAEISFTDCYVGPDAVVGRAGAGMLVAVATLELGRLSVACGSVGIMQAALDASVDYTAHRVQGGRPIMEYQLVDRLIADMATRVAAGRALCRRAAELTDGRSPEAVMATWIAKYFAATGAMQVAADAVQLHGANGCSENHPVARLFRDAKVMEIIEGSNQIQQLTIAEHVYRRAAGRRLVPHSGNSGAS